MNTDTIESLRERLFTHVRDVPDFPSPGILFRDITPILAHPEMLRSAIELQLSSVRDLEGKVDKVVGMESRGFIFGPILAQHLGAGFVPIRKPGKLPAKVIEERYTLEYGSNCLQIHDDALEKSDRVLVVDDLLATGGTAAAAQRLIERLGATVEAFLFLIELSGLNGRKQLNGHRVEAPLCY